jgi:hypothetical protein
MHGFARLQLIGPLALLGPVLGAETAAYALVQRPSSAFLWYLNLEVFGLFRVSRQLTGGFGAFPFSQLLIVAPVALVAIIGVVFRRNLPLAIASNLSLVYAGFLLYSWQFWHGFRHMRQASLTIVQMPAGYDLYLLGMLLGASCLSFAISHSLYLRAMRGTT